MRCINQNLCCSPLLSTSKINKREQKFTGSAMTLQYSNINKLKKHEIKYNNFHNRKQCNFRMFEKYSSAKVQLLIIIRKSVSKYILDLRNIT